MSTFKESIERKQQRNRELMGEKRQEKALREFKEVLGDLVVLLRHSTNVETAYLYWVNTARRQFVLESKSTKCENTMFQDRINFEQHYLNEFKEIEEPVQIEIGRHIPAESLKHYYDDVPVRYLTLLPFINNGQTVAITVLESRYNNMTEADEDVLRSYINALGNLLNTYLEVSDLSEDQQEWVEYEERLEQFDTRLQPFPLLQSLLNQLQEYVQKGGVSLLSQGMQAWNVVMNSDAAFNPPPIGLQLEEHTIGYDALQTGQPEFTIHFNSNPKRISPREPQSSGATLAIPLMIRDRRQALVMVYDENPLIFKEATKHKLTNLVRMAGLKITAEVTGRTDPDEPILSNQYQAYHSDVWESVLETELLRVRESESVPYHTWLAFVSPDDVSALRTQLRLDDLDELQQALITEINPAKFGMPGLVGFHSDYVYALVLQGNTEDMVKQWYRHVNHVLEKPLSLSNGKEIPVSLTVGFTRLDTDYASVQDVVKGAKKALGEAVNHTELNVYEY
ncbi:MAG: GAF domain-containing protein [Bacteroidota bacterium]